ncbi:hypothetical protein BJY04DRAFT_220684 [Aspergillus karnatakaensis]|uniref:Zn(II)2Cys6 transcription factor n=1 Tax=Aspergillus karnatakaensis TaxID=1810916 RepID=UPI003CCD07B5
MQACDICRKRKVKCDRRTPCARCRRLRQPCTYTDILRKKGPKFVHSYPSIYTHAHASVHSSTSVPTSGSASGSGVSLGAYDGLNDVGVGDEYRGDGASGSRTGTGTGSEGGDELDMDMEVEVEMDLGMDFGEEVSSQQQLTRAQELSDEGRRDGFHIFDGHMLSVYEETLYPLYPVVDLRELQLGLQFGYSYSSTRYAMLCSLSAAVHAHLASSSQEDESEHNVLCDKFLRDAIRARAQFDLSALHHRKDQGMDDMSCDREKILSSFFLFMAYWNLSRERHAWWYLRECIALLLSCCLHREDEYRRLEPQEAENRRMIFWGVFVAERYFSSIPILIRHKLTASPRTFCLLHDKPITLRLWIGLPSLPGAFDNSGVVSGFMRLVTLFQGLDIDLSGCWTAAGFVTPVTVNLNITFQAEHDDIEAGSPMQRLSFVVTREWLRARTWKLGVPQGRSSSEFVASKENAHWRLDEPLFIGKAILGILQSFSSDLLRESWSGILDQKLCDICECLYDIQPVMQTRRRAGELNLDQILRGLLEILSRFRGRSAYLLSHACAGISQQRLESAM